MQKIAPGLQFSLTLGAVYAASRPRAPSLINHWQRSFQGTSMVGRRIRINNVDLALPSSSGLRSRVMPAGLPEKLRQQLSIATQYVNAFSSNPLWAQDDIPSAFFL